MDPIYCGHCGELLAEGTHSRCERQLTLEPPRFCSQCRRRMKVQVTPGGWSATCVEHGTHSG
jgi:predicted amidophosphoribosyltransferase